VYYLINIGPGALGNEIEIHNSIKSVIAILSIDFIYLKKKNLFEMNKYLSLELCLAAILIHLSLFNKSDFLSTL
jgi:hypothetical protein